MKKDKSMCSGCREDFYNDHNPYGIKECWSFKKAQVVTRYALGWWTPSDQLSGYQKVTTLDCHREPGQRAFTKEIPDFAK